MKTLFVMALICLSPAMSSAQHDPLKMVSRDTPVAIIDGEIIRLHDLDAYSQLRDPKKVFQLNQQLYEFRQKMLDAMLGDRLLAMEAQAVNLTVDELLARNAIPQPVTEAEVLAIFNRADLQANAGFLQVTFATSRAMITKFLEDQKKAEARARYIETLKAKAKQIGINLDPPRQAITVAKTDPAMGTGTIEIIEFSDFQCPYCKQVQPVLKSLMARFDGRVKLVWKDYPLPNHQFAAPAAEAARCANDQGKFWQYHDVLFANQEALTPEDLKKHAGVVGLDTTSFNQCLDGGKYRSQIQGALQAAARYVVPATPTVFINGRMVMGVAPLETYARIVAEEAN